MSRKIPQFIYKEDKDGNVGAYINPDYEEYRLKEKYKLYLKRSDIPVFYKEISFEDYVGNKSTGNVAKLKKYVAGFSNKYKDISIYLHGEDGCQKTALACNVAKGVMEQGYKAKYIQADTLISLLMKQQSYTINDDIEDRIQDILDSDLVIIDDAFNKKTSLIWKERSENLILSLWKEFLNNIIFNHKRLVITSSIAPSKLENDFGNTIANLITSNFVELVFLDTVLEKRRKRLEI